LRKIVNVEVPFVNVKGNPAYLQGKPGVYVGMTGLDPVVRLDKHKAGIQHNNYVLRYGLQLLPDLYDGYNQPSI
jgi:hypothetical protein